MRAATATSTAAPGAPPAKPSTSARPGSPPSPTPTLGQKKVDRGRLHAGGAAGADGVVLRPGRPVPDRAPPRAELAAGRPAGPAAAREHPQRHGQGADAVPPRLRPGACRGHDELPQFGAGPLAEGPAGGDPGRDARAAADTAGWAGGVAALEARAGGQADGSRRAAAFTDAVSA